MTSKFRVFIQVLAFLAIPAAAFAHGKELEKKGGGPAVMEAGPHGGGVIDIGDGHFELVLETNGSLSLYRLDDDLKVIPAEDVDAAEIHAVSPDQKVFSAGMAKAEGPSVPLHFTAPAIGSLRSYLAVISVSMGDESQNLRFLVNR